MKKIVLVLSLVLVCLSSVNTLGGGGDCGGGKGGGASNGCGKG
jgi:hypothetical protein